MEDSRLDQVLAMADDARCLIQNLRDEGSYGDQVTGRGHRLSEAMALQDIQRTLNEVIRLTQNLKRGAA